MCYTWVAIMTSSALITHKLDCTLKDLALVLSEFQDFVWLESRGSENTAILAFAARDHKVFFKDDTDKFKDFFSSVWKNGASPSPNEDRVFDGGWIGSLCYEAYLFNELLPLTPANLPKTPLAEFYYYDTFILVENGAPCFFSYSEDAEKIFESITQHLCHRGHVPCHPERSEGSPDSQVSRRSFALAQDDTRDFPGGGNPKKYRDDFLKIKERIISGGYFELNYSFENLLPFAADPLAFFLELRESLPAPMMAYLKFPAATVLSASPERFFSVRNGVIKTTPIKGTRPRSASATEDAALLEELLLSDKDRAELLMVTDMLRNDLGRVCEPGGVRVDTVCRAQTFSHYHHLMSDIEGKLTQGVSFFDLFTALFPGGSITGAPKIEVMRDIDKLENRARGVYTGAIGYISDNGNLDFNIPIRTAVVSNQNLSFAVGSGIVADSECAAEFEECRVKAKGFFEALGRFVACFLVVATLFFAACGDTADDVATTETDNTILISSYSFLPESITIAEGETVVFINEDSVSHWIKSESAASAFDDTGDLDSMIIEPGQSREVILPVTAISGTTLLFYDEILSDQMVTPDGEIIVE